MEPKITHWTFKGNSAATNELHSHRRFEEDWLIVIDVQQGDLQRLSGLIRHWLAHVPGHDDKLMAGDIWTFRVTPRVTRSCETTLHTYSLTHAVEALLLPVELHCRGDDSGRGINVEMFPVPVAASGLQETIAHLPVHSLVRVRCINLVHWQAWGLFLWTKDSDHFHLRSC